MLRFLNGVIFTLALFAGAAFAAVELGLVPWRADAASTRLEKWAARTSLNASLRRESKSLTNPLQPNDAALVEGVHTYGANCAVCHGASDAKPSKLAQGFYIEAPMLGEHGVEDDPESEDFLKIKHGIRYTAMPAFGTTLSDEDIWKVAMFLRRMDHLPPAAQAEWEKIPSAAAP